MAKKKSFIILSLLIGLMPVNVWSMGQLARVGIRVSRHQTVKKMSLLHCSPHALNATHRWQQHQSRRTAYKIPFSLLGTAAAFGVASRPKEKDTPFHSELDQKIASLLEQWGFARGEDGSFSRRDETGVLVKIRIGRHTESFSSSPAILENLFIKDEKSKCFSLSFQYAYVASKSYSDKGIAFIVGHELGHIPHLLNNKAVLRGTLRSCEYEADIYSTELNGSTEGGIESFREKIQQEKLPQSEKQILTGLFGLHFLGSALYSHSLIIAAYPILLLGSGSIYKALSQKYPSASERIASINEYARKRGWERHETEDGWEYYVRPESKEQV